MNVTRRNAEAIPRMRLVYARFPSASNAISSGEESACKSSRFSISWWLTTPRENGVPAKGRRKMLAETIYYCEMVGTIWN